MWIYFVSLTIGVLLTNAILSVLIPKLKNREKRGNEIAATDKVVVPDKRLKIIFICLSSFCLLVGLILLFAPQVCVVMGFNWLVANIVWNVTLLVDLAIILFGYQTLCVRYNDDYILITNIFRKTHAIDYSDIVEVTSNIRIITEKKRFFIPCSLFYGVGALKDKITEKLKAKH